MNKFITIAGWIIGSMVSKFYNKKTILRNRIDKLQRKMDELQELPANHSNIRRYVRVSDQLRKAQEQIKNL